MQKALLILLLLLNFTIFTGAKADETASELAVSKACTVDIASESNTENIKLIRERCMAASDLVFYQKKLQEDEFARLHRERVYFAQYIYTIVAFVVLLFLVFVGVIFCVLEYRKGSDSVSTIKFGLTNIEVSSKLVGLLVLFVSLAFGYLFFDKAYPVEDPENNNSAIQINEPQK